MNKENISPAKVNRNSMGNKMNPIVAKHNCQHGRSSTNKSNGLKERTESAVSVLREKKATAFDLMTKKSNQRNTSAAVTTKSVPNQSMTCEAKKLTGNAIGQESVTSNGIPNQLMVSGGEKPAENAVDSSYDVAPVNAPVVNTIKLEIQTVAGAAMNIPNVAITETAINASQSIDELKPAINFETIFVPAVVEGNVCDDVISDRVLAQIEFVLDDDAAFEKVIDNICDARWYFNGGGNNGQGRPKVNRLSRSFNDLSSMLVSRIPVRIGSAPCKSATVKEDTFAVKNSCLNTTFLTDE